MLKGVANIKNWKRDFAGQKIMFNLEEIMGIRQSTELQENNH